MLIFQNGLFATFIPEILMVLGYILCLFAPGIKSDKSSVDQMPIIVQVSTFEQQKQISAYQSSFHDFQTSVINCDKKLPVSPFNERAISIPFESSFSTLDSLSYVDFSRPPPFIVS